MAARSGFLTLASLVDRLSLVQGQFSIGSSGAVSAVQGNGVVSVTHAGTGVYWVILRDSYNKFMALGATQEETSDTPATIASGLTSGVVYVITTVGDASAADWLAVGLPSGQTPAVGVSFLSTSTGSGNSTTARVGGVIATSTANNLTVNTIGSVTKTLHGNALIGGAFALVCRLGSSGALADPANGAVLKFDLLMRNSSVKGLGE